MWVNLDLFWSLLVYLGLSLFLLVSIGLSWSLLVNLIFAALEVVCLFLLWVFIGFFRGFPFLWWPVCLLWFCFYGTQSKNAPITLPKNANAYWTSVWKTWRNTRRELFFYELTSQPTGLVILLVFSCYEERTKFRLGCEALWTTRLEWYLCLHPPQHR